jgi:hypothetical protein
MNPPKESSENPTGPTIRIISAANQQAVQKVAWPSLETPGESRAPVPLPSEPHVELLQQPDGAQCIVVTCTCGRRIEVKCES